MAVAGTACRAAAAVCSASLQGHVLLCLNRLGSGPRAEMRQGRMIIETGQRTSRGLALYCLLPGVPDDELRGQAKRPRNGDDVGVMDDCNRGQEPAVTLHLVPEDVWLAQKHESVRRTVLQRLHSLH